MRIAIAMTFAALVVAPLASAGSSDAVILARMLVGESSFRAATDHAAMLHVIERRARKAGWEPVKMARRYSSVLKVRRPRIMVLGTPEMPPHRTGPWRTVLERVEAWRADKLPDPCPLADHWGDRKGDFERATRAGWTELHCGTVNAFWSVRPISPESPGPVARN